MFSGRFLCASASGELLYLFEYTAGDRMNVLEFDMRTGEVRLLNDTLPYFCLLYTSRETRMKKKLACVLDAAMLMGTCLLYTSRCV